MFARHEIGKTGSPYPISGSKYTLSRLRRFEGVAGKTGGIERRGVFGRSVGLVEIVMGKYGSARGELIAATDGTLSAFGKLPTERTTAPRLST